MLQRVPLPCDTRRDLHRIDRRSRDKRWAHEHSWAILLWDSRSQRLTDGVFGEEHVTYTHPYMTWYRHITRLLVGNPCHREDAGYRLHGSFMEGMVQQMQRIYIRAGEGMNEDANSSLIDIRRYCSESINAYGEHERLNAEIPPAPMHRGMHVPRRPARRIRQRHRQPSPEPEANLEPSAGPPPFQDPNMPCSSSAPIYNQHLDMPCSSSAPIYNQHLQDPNMPSSSTPFGFGSFTTRPSWLSPFSSQTDPSEATPWSTLRPSFDQQMDATQDPPPVYDRPPIMQHYVRRGSRERRPRNVYTPSDT